MSTYNSSLHHSQVDYLFQQGLLFHQQNKFDEAKAIYEQVLRIHPHHFETLTHLGLISGQTKQFTQAVKFLSEALEINSNQPEIYFYKGLALNELNQFETAIICYDKAIKIKADYAEAYLNRGNSLRGLERLDEALASYILAVKIAPSYAEAYYNMGITLLDLQRVKEALKSYEQAIRIKPNYVDAHIKHGNTLKDLRLFDEAIISYEQAILIKPDYAEAYLNLGNILKERECLDEAIISYGKALRIKPDLAEASLNLGLTLQVLQRFDEALASYNQAIRNKPNSAEAYLNRGVALHNLKRFDEALIAYEKALRINPDFAEANLNRGIVLQELKHFDEAMVSYDEAIRIKPNYVEAYLNRGVTLQELKRFDEALVSYDEAIRIKPNYAEAFSNCGIVLQELKRFDEALIAYEKALRINPDFAEAHLNRGVTLQELKRFDEALISYNQALRIKPNYLEAYLNQGTTLQDLKRFDEASASLDKAHTIKPNHDFLIGKMMLLKMQMANWDELDSWKTINYPKIYSGNKISEPFFLLSLEDNLALYRISAEIFLHEKRTPINLTPIDKYEKKNKIRIGYYSADFYNHAITHLTAELFETTNKNNFEIVAFSIGPNYSDDMSIRLIKSFDQFIHANNMSDLSIAQLSRNLQIDIAIDLGGFTKYSRTGIFAFRAAPIQVNYLGYPGTMGANYIDYIIADHTLIPATSRKFYSEKVIYLPNTYQVNDRKKVISDKKFTKSALGLPEGSFVFVCFNNNYKILPSTFDLWCKILVKVEGSILWLLDDNPTAKKNLIKEAVARGIDSTRVVFAERLELSEHLARHRQADLFLDTFPYNAHTTASDALWAGLPVLTMMGESFASRVAASLLNAINLPELITTNQEEYEALAIELASYPAKLKAIRDKLERNRLTTPLFDTPRFTKHLEEAYTKIYERYHADLPPEHIYIEEESTSH